MPAVLVVLSAVLFGTTGTAKALGPADASSLSVGAVRIVVGGAALALVAWIVRSASRRALSATRAAQLASPASHASAQRAPFDSTRTFVALAVGALGVVAYQPLFFTGTSTNGVAVGTIVALGSAPIITGVLSWALNREFPGTRWVLATLLALVGVTLLSGLLSSAMGTTRVDPLGIAASVGAGASYALYTLSSKRLLESGWSPTSAMGGVFGLAAVFAVPLAVSTDLGWLGTSSGIATAAWLGLAATAAAYVLFAFGLQRLSAPTVSTLTLAEPLTATVLGQVVLHEVVGVDAWVGIAVLAAAIVVLAWPARRTVHSQGAH